MAAPKGNQFAKGHGQGRPIIWDDDAIANEAAELLAWIKTTDDMYIGEFCFKRGYHRRRAWDWAQKNDIFKHAWQEAQQWQENKFIKKGLVKEWDPNFVMYLMARVCGDEFKKSYDATSETALKELATAVMNYATAQPAGEGWQKPAEKPKKK